MSMTMERQSKEFRLTGPKVLAITVAFFAIVFAANGIMIYLAIGTFPGAVTGSSYKASQEYNKEIAAAAAQAKLGWVVSERAVLTGDEVKVSLQGREAGGTPLSNVVFSARLMHPVKQGQDRTGEMKPVAGAPGRFEATIPGAEPGQWDLEIDGLRNGQRIYRSVNRVNLK